MKRPDHDTDAYKLYQATWRANNPNYQRNWREQHPAYDILRRYDITQKEYDSLLESQNGCCAICHREVTLTVDHDHITGKIRGLLCNRCNVYFSWFEQLDFEINEYKLH
jgi:hypothetical protein